MDDLYTLITVDDERFIHLGLDKLIKWEQFNLRKIGEAYNGDSALELIKNKRPHVILTDIRMPGIDGLDLISQVTQIPNYKPQLVIISGYESFSYAKKAMNYGVKYYLLKPIDKNELEEILTSINNKLNKRSQSNIISEKRLLISALIRRLLRDIPTMDHIDKAKEILGDIKPSRFVQIILQNSLDSNIEDKIRKILVGMNAPITSEKISQISNNKVGIILSENEIPECKLEEFISILQKSCSKIFAGNLYISVGIYINKLEDLYKSYISSQIVFDKILLQSSQPYYIVNDLYELEKKSDTQFVKKAMFFPELIKSIEENSKDEILKNMEGAYSWIIENKVCPGTVKLWINCLIIDVSRIVTELGGYNNSYIDTFAADVLQEPFIFSREIFNKIISFTIKSGEVINSIEKNNQSGVICMVIQNLEKNFFKNISLKDLGEEYNQNPVYLGQLFKSKVGTSFKQYLTNLRIEEAKKLLKRTDLKVYEVSKSVGYDDCDYFTRQFIKVTGQSPICFKKDC
ncbi:MAG: response regulator [Spirochaetales bacterium]|nr:response regulator [Spirochaetales bacterium]